VFGVPTVVSSVLSPVRLCEIATNQSGNVDVLGNSSTRKATLFFFVNQSKTNGNYTLPEITTGDRIAEGSVSTLPESAWTVFGVLKAKGATSIHHLEVSLV
jgi:hypothetical protein